MIFLFLKKENGPPSYLEVWKCKKKNGSVVPQINSCVWLEIPPGKEKEITVAGPFVVQNGSKGHWHGMSASTKTDRLLRLKWTGNRLIGLFPASRLPASVKKRRRQRRQSRPQLFWLSTKRNRTSVSRFRWPPGSSVVGFTGLFRDPTLMARIFCVRIVQAFIFFQLFVHFYSSIFV